MDMLFKVYTEKSTMVEFLSSSLVGVVRLLKDGQKQWELQVDHSLFAIGKLDVTVSQT